MRKQSGVLGPNSAIGVLAPPPRVCAVFVTAASTQYTFPVVSTLRVLSTSF